MSVFLANEQADYRVDEPALTRLARLVMDAEGVEESEVSLLLVNRSVMTFRSTSSSETSDSSTPSASMTSRASRVRAGSSTR